MKKVAFLSLCVFFSLALFSQTFTPTQVLDAFSEREPDVKSPFWEYREGAFVAMFLHEDGLKKMFFNENGAWLETRTRIGIGALPSGVMDFIDENYADANITYIGKVNQPQKTVYRVESELNASVVIKLLDDQGLLLEEHKIDWNLMPD